MKNRFENLSPSNISLSEGIDPPKSFEEPETVITGRLNCIVCGKLSSLGVKNMETGEWEPIDKCKDCFMYGSCVLLTKQIILKENI